MLLQQFGDSYASGFLGYGGGPDNFGAILAADLKSDFDNRAIAGTGYANSDGGATFLAQANSYASAAATTTMFFGSLNDQTLSASTVQSNAAAAYARVKQVAPATKLVVVGPQWPNAARASDLLGKRDAVKAAALAAGATFIDPLADGWFDTRPELIGADGFHPTTAGHRHIHRLIAAALGVLPVNR